MRKALIKRNLNMLLACSLVASFAAFGCTTNTMRGAGEPWTGGPGVGPSSPSSTSGTSVPTTPPPMTSSYTRADEPVKPMRSHMLPLSAAEAAAIMAGHQPRVRVLGPVDPGPATRPYVSDGLVTGRNAYANPQVSINSSINNPGGGMAITSGVGSDVTADAAAAVFTQSLTTATPTVLGAAVPPTTAATTAGGTVITGTTTTSATTNATTSATTAGTTTAVAASTSPATVSTGSGTIVSPTRAAAANGNVRVVTTSGKVVVTNVKSQ